MQHPFDDFDPLAHVSGTDFELLHLLTCADCRSRTINRLLEASVEGEEDSQVDYEPLLARLSQVDPARLEEARARQAEAERLFEELMARPGEERIEALRAPRFRTGDFLDVLLEQSQVRQLEAPRQAVEIAVLAAQLAANLGEEEGTVEGLLRALCLEVNALRLTGDLKQGEELLARASVFLETADDRAFYCRALALIRWEQGREEEAVALLEHAARLYAASGPPGEHGVCLALLGLLAAEKGNTAEALPLLFQGWAVMDRDLRPLIAARVALSLAFCFAAAGEEEQTRSFLEEAGRLTPEIRDENEMVRAWWQEARVAGRLGHKGKARALLEPVLQALAAEGGFAEAVLVALDLTAVSEGGDLAWIAELLQSAAPLPSFAAVLELGLNAIRTLGRCTEESGVTFEECVKVTSVTLRRTFRSCGVPMKPLPFA